MNNGFSKLAAPRDQEIMIDIIKVYFKLHRDIINQKY